MCKGCSLSNCKCTISIPGASERGVAEEEEGCCPSAAFEHVSLAQCCLGKRGAGEGGGSGHQLQTQLGGFVTAGWGWAVPRAEA